MTTKETTINLTRQLLQFQWTKKMTLSKWPTCGRNLIKNWKQSQWLHRSKLRCISKFKSWTGIRPSWLSPFIYGTGSNSLAQGCTKLAASEEKKLDSSRNVAHLRHGCTSSFILLPSHWPGNLNLATTERLARQTSRLKKSQFTFTTLGQASHSSSELGHNQKPSWTPLGNIRKTTELKSTQRKGWFR